MMSFAISRPNVYMKHAELLIIVSVIHLLIIYSIITNHATPTVIATKTTQVKIISQIQSKPEVTQPKKYQLINQPINQPQSKSTPTPVVAIKTQNHPVKPADNIASKKPLSEENMLANKTIIDPSPVQATESSIASTEKDIKAKTPNESTSQHESTPQHQSATKIEVSSISYLTPPIPKYPKLSKQLKEQGVVMLRVEINTKGLPENVTLEKSSGFSRLDAAALSAVKNATFKPYTENAIPHRAWCYLPINFELES